MGTKKTNWEDWDGLVSFERNDVSKILRKVPHTTVALFTGNQFGKTRTVCGHYIPLALTGRLKHKRFNIYPDEKIRTIRLASENLPNDNEGGEVRNTVYPALMEAIPREWVKRDITTRKPVVIIKSPLGGPDVPVELVSYGQSTQSQAGVQRKLIVLDELSPYEFYQEQMPRIMAGNGRLIISVTSINASWLYDEIFERARTYIRTATVVRAYKEYLGKDVKAVEHTNSVNDICVIQAATDDNPMWKDMIKKRGLQISVPDYITKYTDYNDSDTVLMRRYGILKQASGAIFKAFHWDVHFISRGKWFPNGLSDKWRHARLIDYHDTNPWAINWAALSFENELFVYREANPNPEKDIVANISRMIANKSFDIGSYVDLMDPLGAKVQPSVGVSVMQDMNRCLLQLKREGVGSGGYFQSWDTKSSRGRDEIKKRLKNAREVGQPFNNKVVRFGKTEVLPTIWILDDCMQTALSLKNWRTEEWKDKNAAVSKDPRETPQQKWSHHCMCLEACLKHPAFQSPPRNEPVRMREVPQRFYGQRR